MTNGKDLVTPITISDDHDNKVWAEGLTKREHFAGLALQGMLAANDDTVTDFAKKNGIDYGKAITIMSVSLADDLIDALNEEYSNDR